MKIHAPDGSIIEVDTKEDLELYKLLTALPDSRENEKTAGMNKWQNELYFWLIDNDCEDGVTINAAACHFKISDGAAGQRLSRMVNKDFAKRVGAGRYRAI